MPAIHESLLSRGKRGDCLLIDVIHSIIKAIRTITNAEAHIEAVAVVGHLELADAVEDILAEEDHIARINLDYLLLIHRGFLRLPKAITRLESRVGDTLEILGLIIQIDPPLPDLTIHGVGIAMPGLTLGLGASATKTHAIEELGEVLARLPNALLGMSMDNGSHGASKWTVEGTWIAECTKAPKDIGIAGVRLIRVMELLKGPDSIIKGLANLSKDARALKHGGENDVGGDPGEHDWERQHHSKEKRVRTP